MVLSPSSKRLLWLGGAVVVLAALLVPRLDDSEQEAAAAVPEAEEVLEVEARQLEPRSILERFSTVGTLQADERVELRSEISGILERIHFDEGSRVAAGDLLIEIDDALASAERDRARYRFDLAKLREERQEDLLAQGLLSQDEYDVALNELNVLAADLRLAEARLEKTQIRAPFGGLVGFRYVSPGAALTPQTRIATLLKIDRVKLEFSVPERYASRVRRGESVRFGVKGVEGDYHGEIYAVEPTVDRETRSLRARALSPNPRWALLPGAFADVEIVVNEIEDALTVPAIAVIPELGSRKVFVIEEGRAAPRIVETGVRTDTEVEILRGLEVGDRVIVSAIQQLSAGLAVRERTAL